MGWSFKKGDVVHAWRAQAASCIGPFGKFGAGGDAGGGLRWLGMTARLLADGGVRRFVGLFGLGLPDFYLAAHEVVAFAGGLL